MNAIKMIKTMKRRKVKETSILTQRTKIEKVTYAIVFVIFAVYAATLLFPFVWLVINSLEDPVMYNVNVTLYGAFRLPGKPFFSNYLDAFEKMVYNETSFFGMLFNSVWYIALGSTWCVFWPVLTGYVMSKYKFKGREIIHSIAILCLTIPIVGQTSFAYKLYAMLNIYDTGPLFVIITGINGFSSSYLIYCSIFKNLSWSYAESVFIDGGGDITAFVRVMLPQAMPAISAMIVNGAIGLWNEYYSIMMFLPSTPTVAVGLYQVSLSITRFGQPLYYAGLVIATVPLIIVYGCMAGNMMKNLTIGGLKG